MPMSFAASSSALARAVRSRSSSAAMMPPTTATAPRAIHEKRASHPWPLPGDEVDVLNGAGNVLQLILLERREEWNLGDLIDSEHDSLTTSSA